MVREHGLLIDVGRVRRVVDDKLTQNEMVKGDPLIELEEPLLTPDELFGLSLWMARFIVDRNVYIEFNPGSKWPLLKIAASGFNVNGEDLSFLKPVITLSSDDPGQMLMDGIQDELLNVALLLRLGGMEREKVNEFLLLLIKNGRRRGDLFAGVTTHSIADSFFNTIYFEHYASMDGMPIEAQAKVVESVWEQVKGIGEVEFVSVNGVILDHFAAAFAGGYPRLSALGSTSTDRSDRKIYIYADNFITEYKRLVRAALRDEMEIPQGNRMYGEDPATYRKMWANLAIPLLKREFVGMSQKEAIEAMKESVKKHEIGHKEMVINGVSQKFNTEYMADLKGISEGKAPFYRLVRMLIIERDEEVLREIGDYLGVEYKAKTWAEFYEWVRASGLKDLGRDALIRMARNVYAMVLERRRLNDVVQDHARSDRPYTPQEAEEKRNILARNSRNIVRRRTPPQWQKHIDRVAGVLNGKDLTTAAYRLENFYRPYVIKAHPKLVEEFRAFDQRTGNKTSAVWGEFKVGKHWRQYIIILDHANGLSDIDIQKRIFHETLAINYFNHGNIVELEKLLDPVANLVYEPTSESITEEEWVRRLEKTKEVLRAVHIVLPFKDMSKQGGLKLYAQDKSQRQFPLPYDRYNRVQTLFILRRAHEDELLAIGSDGHGSSSSLRHNGWVLMKAFETLSKLEHGRRVEHEVWSLDEKGQYHFVEKTPVTLLDILGPLPTPYKVIADNESRNKHDHARSDVPLTDDEQDDLGRDLEEAVKDMEPFDSDPQFEPLAQLALDFTQSLELDVISNEIKEKASVKTLAPPEIVKVIKANEKKFEEENGCENKIRAVNVVIRGVEHIFLNPYHYVNGLDYALSILLEGAALAGYAQSDSGILEDLFKKYLKRRRITADTFVIEGLSQSNAEDDRQVFMFNPDTYPVLLFTPDQRQGEWVGLRQGKNPPRGLKSVKIPKYVRKDGYSVSIGQTLDEHIGQYYHTQAPTLLVVQLHKNILHNTLSIMREAKRQFGNKVNVALVLDRSWLEFTPDGHTMIQKAIFWHEQDNKRRWIKLQEIRFPKPVYAHYMATRASASLDNIAEIQTPVSEFRKFQQLASNKAKTNWVLAMAGVPVPASITFIQPEFRHLYREQLNAPPCKVRVIALEAYTSDLVLEQLQGFRADYPAVVVKPVRGSQGKGVELFIENDPTGEIAAYILELLGKRSVKNAKLDDVILEQRLSARDIRKGSRIIDSNLRFLGTKDLNGNFITTCLVARCGDKGGPINISQTAYTTNFRQLASDLGLEEHEILALERKIRKVAIDSVLALHAEAVRLAKLEGPNYLGLYGNMSVDFFSVDIILNEDKDGSFKFELDPMSIEINGRNSGGLWHFDEAMRREGKEKLIGQGSRLFVKLAFRRATEYKERLEKEAVVLGERGGWVQFNACVKALQGLAGIQKILRIFHYNSRWHLEGGLKARLKDHLFRMYKFLLIIHNGLFISQVQYKDLISLVKRQANKYFDDLVAAILLHDLGKKQAARKIPGTDSWSFTGHEEESYKLILNNPAAVTFKGKAISPRVLFAVRHHDMPWKINCEDPDAFKGLMETWRSNFKCSDQEFKEYVNFTIALMVLDTLGSIWENNKPGDLKTVKQFADKFKELYVASPIKVDAARSKHPLDQDTTEKLVRLIAGFAPQIIAQRMSQRYERLRNEIIDSIERKGYFDIAGQLRNSIVINAPPALAQAIKSFALRINNHISAVNIKIKDQVYLIIVDHDDDLSEFDIKQRIIHEAGAVVVHSHQVAKELEGLIKKRTNATPIPIAPKHGTLAEALTAVERIPSKLSFDIKTFRPFWRNPSNGQPYSVSKTRRTLGYLCSVGLLESDNGKYTITKKWEYGKLNYRSVIMQALERQEEMFRATPMYACNLAFMRNAQNHLFQEHARLFQELETAVYLLCLQAASEKEAQDILEAVRRLVKGIVDEFSDDQAMIRFIQSLAQKAESGHEALQSLKDAEVYLQQGRRVDLLGKDTNKSQTLTIRVAYELPGI